MPSEIQLHDLLEEFISLWMYLFRSGATEFQDTWGGGSQYTKNEKKKQYSMKWHTIKPNYKRSGG